MGLGQRTARVVAALVLFAVGCSPVAAIRPTGGETNEARGVSRAADGRGIARIGASLDAGPAAGLTGAAGPVRGRNLSVGSPDLSIGGTIVARVTGDGITARTFPEDDAPPVASFTNPTEFGGPQVFQVVEPDRDRDGWLEVLLPVRPNGTTGWIRTSEVEQTVNPYRIEVDASAYELRILRFDEETLSTTVAIGNGATPTPLGRFYLVELLRPSDPGGLYGPYAYGLSGYSDTLDSYNGGQGVIGIHGTDQPELLGQDVSHGCIRVANPTIEEMVGFLPLGTPVHIFRTAPAPTAPTGTR
ncbi:MAG: L,D-transpeptidase [Actinomycetota bacterium]